MARDSLGLGVEGGLNPRLGFRSRGVEGSFPLVPTRPALFSVARSSFGSPLFEEGDADFFGR